MTNTTRVLSLLLLMLICSVGTLALADTNPVFSAAATGPVTKTTITANVAIADQHLGQPGAIYVVAKVGNQYYAYDSNSWWLWDGGAFASFRQGALQNTSFDVDVTQTCRVWPAPCYISVMA